LTFITLKELRMPARPDHATRSDELAREQSLIELEQAVADCEQFAGDRDQGRIDYEQLHHDEARRSDAESAGHPSHPIVDDRQARIDRQQLSRDGRQEALDDAQRGRDEQQEALDDARMVLELPISAPPDAAGAVQRDAIDRAVAARERAEAHLMRAQGSIVRAQAAEARARAFVSPDAR
jgi:hypothetical protein